MLKLRPYQDAAVGDVVAAIERSPILVAPTGAGKTVMGVEVARRRDCRVVWVAHRRELIRQAHDAVVRAGGEAGIIMAGEEADPDAPIQVCSVQTLARRELPPGDLLVVDEAHHATADGYKRLMQSYRWKVGLTATPFRLDGKGLGACGFDEIVVAAYTDDLCADGTLHAPRVFAGKGPDLTGVGRRGGDFALGELSDAVTKNAKLTGDIVENWLRRAEGRRTVCFAVSVEHGREIAKRFCEAGVTAEVVTGETPLGLRDAILERLAIGTTSVVVNCMVLTEGWDLPSLEVAICARPTDSLCLHLQMIGRIMRACDDKDGAVVLDHAGNYYRHGLVTDRLEYTLHGKVTKKPSPTKACPECELVMPRTEKTCPGCGYTFTGSARERDLCPRDSAHLLEEVTVAPGAGEDFATRERRWRGWLQKGERIARFRAQADADGLVFNLPANAQDAAYAVARGEYKRRYGVNPVHVGPRLLDPSAPPGAPGHVSQVDWARLLEAWAEIGRRKGWPPSKVDWFVKRNEAEARGGRA